MPQGWDLYVALGQLDINGFAPPQTFYCPNATQLNATLNVTNDGGNTLYFTYGIRLGRGNPPSFEVYPEIQVPVPGAAAGVTTTASYSAQRAFDAIEIYCANVYTVPGGGRFLPVFNAQLEVINPAAFGPTFTQPFDQFAKG